MKQFGYWTTCACVAM